MNYNVYFTTDGSHYVNTKPYTVKELNKVIEFIDLLADKVIIKSDNVGTVKEIKDENNEST